LRFDAESRLAGFTAEARELFGLQANALGTPLDQFAAEHLDAVLAATARTVRGEGGGEGGVVTDPRGRRWHAELRAEETGGDDVGLVLTLTAAEGEPPAAPAAAPAFAAVLAHADLAAALLDAEGRVLWANPALGQLLDAETATLVGTDWFAHCVPAERRLGLRHRFERALAHAATAEARTWRVDCPLVDAGGNPRRVAWHGVPLAAEGTPALALLGREVTAERRDRRALEAAGLRAEQASALKSRVLAAVAHDLKHPLQTLRFVHGVLARTVADPAGREIVGALEDSVNEMARAIQLLVQVSRRAPFDGTPRPTTVALGGLLSAVRARFADTAAAKGLTLTVTTTSARVRSDPALLGQLLDELVAAAVRHTETGRVLVGCRRRGPEVVLEIADTRAAAPLAQLAAAVGAGAEPATDADGGGFARRLEALADHRLEVRTVLGRGAVFALHLPSAEAAAVRAAAPPAAGGEVLLVADDVAARDSVAQLLELEGYQVLAAKDVDEALAELDGRTPPRVAVVDRRVGCGADAATLERHLRARAGAPVSVAAVVDATPSAAERATTGGVYFLERPTGPQAILALVAEAAAAPGTRPPARPRPPAPDDERPSAVISADAAARDHFTDLLRAAGHAVASFASTAAFLADATAAQAACVLLDLGRAGRSGVAELAALAQGDAGVPVVVLHAGDDVGVAVAAMRAGAFDFLAAPVCDDVLVETLRLAVREGRRRERRLEAEEETRRGFDRLTARERDVLRLVVAGRSNKEVAQALGISPRTVENHRARIMEKTAARSLAELVARTRNVGLDH
jgi:two-component system CheB/CheR fusion protein